MKRYIDFRNEDWEERTDARMQAARWEACVNGLRIGEPMAGVIDTYPLDILQELLEEGWVAYLSADTDSGVSLRKHARQAMMSTLTDDLNCLAENEYELVERMLISDGQAAIDSVADVEAAYTLRMRLWADISIVDDMPIAQLDGPLLKRLPPLLMERTHLVCRRRIAYFDSAMRGLLYISGYLDDRMPQSQFIEDVLRMPPNSRTRRLARNFMEASFDTYTLAGCNLLVHEALSDPEALGGVLAARGAYLLPSLDDAQLTGSMNNLLPEEMVLDETLQRALHGALRPEWDADEAASNLRYLAKQNVPSATIHQIMASMLCVMPTPHMQGALWELQRRTPRWIEPVPMPPPGSPGAAPGILH